MNSYILKGDICYTPSIDKLLTYPDSYLICESGRTKGIFENIPDEYSECTVYDYSGMLIIPGLVDLHIHAPQFPFRGTGMDCELTEWLNKYTFPCEEKYRDPVYAEKAYCIFAEHIKKSATTHAVILSTVHRHSTELLMDLMEETGIVSFTGKVNMDRNAPDSLCEKNTDETVSWLKNISGKYSRTYPIITPRFAPCCSSGFLNDISGIRRNYSLPVQSHLSENTREVKWVNELFPECEFYGDVYEKHNLFGYDRNTQNGFRTVMAHCVYSSDKELSLIKKNNVFIAHCPSSNTNLRSGIAPVRKYLELGLKTGLGSDVAAGHTESVLHAACEAVRMSKLYNIYCDTSAAPLTFTEAFYLATKGGGEFFSEVNNGFPAGTFEPGGNFSAVVINDTAIPSPDVYTLSQRLERAAYLSADAQYIMAKFAEGVKII